MACAIRFTAAVAPYGDANKHPSFAFDQPYGGPAHAWKMVRDIARPMLRTVRQRGQAVVLSRERDTIHMVGLTDHACMRSLNENGNSRERRQEFAITSPRATPFPVYDPLKDVHLRPFFRNPRSPAMNSSTLMPMRHTDPVALAMGSGGGPFVSACGVAAGSSSLKEQHVQCVDSPYGKFRQPRGMVRKDKAPAPSFHWLDSALSSVEPLDDPDFHEASRVSLRGYRSTSFIPESSLGFRSAMSCDDRSASGDACGAASVEVSEIHALHFSVDSVQLNAVPTPKASVPRALTVPEDPAPSPSQPRHAAASSLS